MTDIWTTKLDTYLDGELSSEEMRALDVHVRECSSCAADVLNRVQLRRAVKMGTNRYRASSELRHKIGVSIRPKKQSAFLGLRTALAGMVLVLLITILGAYTFREQIRQRQVFNEIADLHVSTLASANPVDVVSSDRHTVKPWFEGKLPFSFSLPELQNSGFTLIGGRVTYLRQLPGAQLIYQVRKHQISAFIFQDSEASEHLPSDSGPKNRNSFGVETWSNEGLRYFVVGDASPDDIRRLADLLKSAAKS